MPEDQTDAERQLAARLDSAVSSSVPKLYINGFVATQSSSDVILVGELMNQPVMMVHLSYTMAKTLAQSLTGIIANLEEKMGRDIMTTGDIDRQMKGGKNP